MLGAVRDEIIADTRAGMAHGFLSIWSFRLSAIWAEESSA
jgi:hypothetical protein